MAFGRGPRPPPPVGTPRGIEDVQYHPIETGQGVPRLVPRGARAPALIADSIQPVVVLGDGRGSGSSANEITPYSFASGGVVFGSTTIGSPYFEFHAPKTPASPLARQIVSALTGFLDSYLPVGLFSITAGPGTGPTLDRLCIVRDVVVSPQFGGTLNAALPIIAVGFFQTVNPSFRVTANSISPTPGLGSGVNQVTPRSQLSGGQLNGGIQFLKNATAGNHAIWHADAQTFWMGNVNNNAGLLRPFEHLVPFYLKENQGIFIGQTNFGQGPDNGTTAQFGVDVVWSEVPTGGVS